MSIPTRGGRPITVDGRAYRWRIRRRATYGQDIFGGPMRISIQSGAPGARGVLVVDTACPRPDATIYGHGGGVTPAQVSDMIRQALAAGWEPGSGRMELRYPLLPDHIGPALPVTATARDLSPMRARRR